MKSYLKDQIEKIIDEGQGATRRVIIQMDTGADEYAAILNAWPGDSQTRDGDQCPRIVTATGKCSEAQNPDNNKSFEAAQVYAKRGVTGSA